VRGRVAGGVGRWLRIQTTVARGRKVGRREKSSMLTRLRRELFECLDGKEISMDVSESKLASGDSSEEELYRAATAQCKICSFGHADSETTQ